MNDVNFCTRIFEAGRRHPDRLALRVPDIAAPAGAHEDLTYGALLSAVGKQQSALKKSGLSCGDRVLLFTPPGISLYVTLLALLGLGMVPVMVERGMPRNRLRATLTRAHATAVIGDRAIMKYWWLFPALWKISRFALDGRSLGVRDFRQLVTPENTSPECHLLNENSPGLITFTSGSTGLPKGADRTHGSLIAQHLAIRSHWLDQDNDIDLPVFPVLVLHNLCCGISTILPDTDLSFPGNVAAPRVFAQIMRQHVTRIAGSPAYMDRITAYALAHHLIAGHVRSVIIGGSTLTWALAERCRLVFPHAEIRVVYGSTEAEPIADVNIDILITDWHQHAGHLVGHPAEMATVCIVSTDSPLQTEDDVTHAQTLNGTEGEILVSGPHVLKAYVENPEATRETKIARSNGSVWHRTGDTGFFDNQGRLWLTGRIKDRILANGKNLSPFAVEKELDALPGIERSALIDDADGPVLVIKGQFSQDAKIIPILRRHMLDSTRIAYVHSMPVDARHNSKIDRPRLREWLKSGRLRLQAIDSGKHA